MPRYVQASTVSLFRDLQAARRAARANARNARMHYVVVGQKKNGFPAKVTASDMQYNATERYGQAEARKQHLEGLNPGRNFVIVCL